MHWSLTFLVAASMLGMATAMVLYERRRLRLSPPFPVTEGGRVLYWMSYLSLFVLGLTVLIAGVVY